MSSLNVLEGEREEWRRILLEGVPHWVRPEGESLILGDGREIDEVDAVYLPPCDPTKILCVHLNYVSRAEEFGVKMGRDAHLLPEAHDRDERTSRGASSPRGLPVSQLRG